MAPNASGWFKWCTDWLSLLCKLMAINRGFSHIGCSVRQGCPLSMILFSLVVNPLIVLLKDRLPGVRIAHRNMQTSVIKYAYDITLLLRNPADFHLNIKSKALAVGSWYSSALLANTPYFLAISVLGFRIASTTKESRQLTWSTVTGQVMFTAKETYSMDLCLQQRIWFVHTFLLWIAWYVAQILPAPVEQIRQLVTAVPWCTWHGAMFRVPLSTMQRPVEAGGLGLIEVSNKCLTTSLARCRTQAEKTGSLDQELFRFMGLLRYNSKPSPRYGNPRQTVLFAHLFSSMGLHWASTKRRIMVDLPTNSARHPETSDFTGEGGTKNGHLTLKTDIAWSVVWNNLSRAIFSTEILSMWYVVIHGILPTDDRPYRYGQMSQMWCTSFNRVRRQLRRVALNSNSYSFNSTQCP